MNSGGPIFLQGAAEKARDIVIKLKWTCGITAVLACLFAVGCYIRVTVPVAWPIGSTLLAVAGAVGVVWLLVRRPPCLQCAARAQLEAGPTYAQLEPRPMPARPGRRPSDYDRERAIEKATQAFVGGDGDLSTHERRVAMLLQATTYEELDAAQTLGEI